MRTLMRNGLLVAIFVAAAFPMACRHGAAQARRIPSKVIRKIPQTCNYASGLAWDRSLAGKETIWVCDNFSRTLQQIDPYTGIRMKTLVPTLQVFRGLAHDGLDLWMCAWPLTGGVPHSIFRLNPVNGKVIQGYVAPFTKGASNGLAWSGPTWVAEQAGLIYKMDALKWTVLTSFSVPGQYNTTDPTDLAYDTRSRTLWVGYGQYSLIRQHNEVTGAAIAETPSPYGRFQRGLTWDGNFLWATGGQQDRTISQIDVTPPFMVLMGPLKGGTRISFELTNATNESGNLFVAGWSGSGTRGFKVGGKAIPLTFDSFTMAGLALVPWFQGVVDSSGTATTPKFKWPSLPPGISFWVAGVTLGPSGLVSITEPQKHVTR